MLYRTLVAKVSSFSYEKLLWDKQWVFLRPIIYRIFFFSYTNTIYTIAFLNEAMKKKKEKNSFDYLLVTNIYFMKELYMLSKKIVPSVAYKNNIFG